MTESKPETTKMGWTEAEWAETFRVHHALWTHDGDPHHPHVQLTKGGHSDGYFNWDAMAETSARHHASEALAKLGFDKDAFKRYCYKYRAVGPAMGAITLAADVAREVTRGVIGWYVFDEPCLGCYSGYTEKVFGPDGKTVIGMVCNRLKPQPDELVILCEDTITTGESVLMSQKAVEACGAEVLPFVLCIMNRSGLTHVGGLEIIALVTHTMHNWSAEECPLCKQGSQALAGPKKGNNWELLTQPDDD